MNNDQTVIINRIRKLCETDEQKLMMIITTVGCAASIMQFVFDNFDIEQLPDSIAYCSALTAGNLMAIMSGETLVNYVNIEQLQLGEQAEEVIYRKMVYVIEKLYAHIQENKKELNTK